MKFFPVRTGLILLAACLAGGMQMAGAQSRSTAETALSSDDVSFLKQAAENGHVEIESAQLVLTRAATAAPVRNYAQTMLDEHRRSSEELKSLAAANRVELPTQPSLVQRARLKLLANDEGAEFSRNYIESMGIEAHEDNIELFEDAAEEADSPAVKAFANKSLPTLQKHLSMARELHDALKRSADARSGTQNSTPTPAPATR